MHVRPARRRTRGSFNGVRHRHDPHPSHRPYGGRIARRPRPPALAVSGAAPGEFPVSWEQLHRDAKTLAGRLAGLGRWERVLAVTRGGMVPACIVARELEVRLVDTVCIVSYDHMTQGELTVLKAPPADASGGGGDGGSSGGADDGARTLVVDDLADTGKTLAALRERYPRAHFATVYAKPQGRPLVDTFVMEVAQDTWIHLPWDLELRFAAPLAKAGKDGAEGAGAAQAADD